MTHLKDLFSVLTTQCFLRVEDSDLFGVGDRTQLQVFTAMDEPSDRHLGCVMG